MGLFKRRDKSGLNEYLVRDEIGKLDRSAFGDGGSYHYQDKPLVKRLAEMEEQVVSLKHGYRNLEDEHCSLVTRLYRLMEHLGVKEGIEEDK